MPLDDPSGSLVAVVETIDVDTDTLHDILADRRRRYTLARLQERGRSMHLGDLATEIAEWEDGQDGLPGPETPETVHQSLYHIHIAKMSDAGLVDYDGMRDAVALADRGNLVATQLTPSTDA